MRKYYAGIGSRRRTPSFIHNLMTKTATKLELMDYALRSGSAIGADKAFERGVSLPENKEIFRPKHATVESIQIASQYHPYWDHCDNYVKKLHGRNVFIILGKNLKNPAKFVICYTSDGKFSGGTGLGMSIAKDHGIPIFNLYYPDVRSRLENFIGEKKGQYDGDILMDSQEDAKGINSALVSKLKNSCEYLLNDIH